MTRPITLAANGLRIIMDLLHEPSASAPLDLPQLGPAPSFPDRDDQPALSNVQVVPAAGPFSREVVVEADATSCSHSPLSFCPNCLNCQDCGFGCTCEPIDYPEEEFIA